ncbi:MAG: N-acetylmuramoyl-L-alanine amidase [Ruminococcus sp.]|nr:N-acetylmuramoyl-L-alanine amidase [Ruminococcus sp.]
MKIKLKTLYIIICAVLFCVFAIILFSAFSDVKVSAELSENHPTIIIDAGHGGEDGGAEVNGVLEKDINLNISLMLRDMLIANGYDVKTVRDSDISVYSDGADTLSEKKTSDLHNRVNLFNSDGNNIVVSIHQNKFENSKYSGTQVFYSDNHKNSVVLAESIRTAVVMLLQPDNTRELKPASKDIFILDQANVPAVIVECGFLSNDEERQKLTDEAYQKKMAYSIMLGIMDYCNKQET